MAVTLVVGLTPGLASAAPPDPVSAPAQPRPSVAPPIVIGSIALASSITAIVFTARSAVASRSLAADLDARVQYDQDDRRLQVGRRDAIVAASMYGVTAAVGALLLVVTLRPVVQARRRASVAASVGPDGGALVLTVGF